MCRIVFVREARGYNKNLIIEALFKNSTSFEFLVVDMEQAAYVSVCFVGETINGQVESNRITDALKPEHLN